MFDSNRNDLEGTDVLKDSEERSSSGREERSSSSSRAAPDDSRSTAVDDIEETILRHCWTKTDECPACGCVSSLRIGVETEGDEFVTAPDCQLCDAVVRTIADGVEFDLT